MKNRSDTKKSFTSWKIGDFILQLSVVVLGIIITFAISANFEGNTSEVQQMLEQTISMIDQEYQ